MQLFSILSTYASSIQKNTLFGLLLATLLCTFFSKQTASAQLPNGFEPLEQARVVKRIDIRKIPANGIIRLFDEKCTQTAHIAGVRLVYARNDHKSLQGQKWTTSLTYNLLRPQDKNNANNSAANVAIQLEIPLAIGEQITAPYLQTFIDAKTHTLDYSSLNLGYSYNQAEIRIKIVGLPVLHPNAPDDIWLELELYETSNLPFNSTQNDYHFLARQAGTDIVVAWDYVETAYEYELEWVWIDKAETLQANPNSNFDENWIENNPEKIFEYREGVSVQTTDQHFIFPNTFLEGRVFYRVRAIGRFIPENVPNYGEWNYGYDKTDHIKKTAFITLSNDYETTHNWQSVTSFAENAKYKTVVSYHDGTGRNRQVVTHLSSERRTLIAETLYDYEGNPTVNILPVSLEGTNLSYHENLNPFVGANPFSKKNYDNGTTSTALDTISGAAQYYSANNTSGGRYAERLPDAKGFAYSRTTYLRDGTGRVREQGGLGETYQVGRTHSTKMFYGSTNDAELKRLFGRNVGKASFYRKQITQDPNGQLSVSYLDAAGQVIATALTGEVPQNVLALESYEARTIDVDLKENNIKDELNRRSLSENTIFNNIPGATYNFTYKVDAKTGIFMGQCLTCQYELSISIYDENGQGVEFRDSTTNNLLATGLLTKTIDPATCNLAQDIEIKFLVKLPEIGTYQVRKELKVISNEKLEAKVNSIIASDSAVITTKYQDEALANNPCDICFTCFPADYNPLELFEGMDCESILVQIQAAIDKDPEDGLDTLTDHPEFCHYLACKDFTKSKTFMLEMSRVFDWTEAVDKYNLPDTIPPTDEAQEVEDFIKQDSLFNLYPAYVGQLRDLLLQLKNLSGDNLQDANNDPISIWDLINPNITFASHPILFDAEKENIPFQDVKMSSPQEIAERQWDLFRSNYLRNYEIVKESILKDKYECSYLEDQDTAIVKNPNILNDIKDTTDINNFEQDFNDALAPNCDMQVQLWMGQLKNSCNNLTDAEWATIQDTLTSYCNNIDSRVNPLHVLLRGHPWLIPIKEQLEAACPEAQEAWEALFFIEAPSVTSSPLAIIRTHDTPPLLPLSINQLDYQDFTLQFNIKPEWLWYLATKVGVLRMGDLKIERSHGGLSIYLHNQLLFFGVAPPKFSESNNCFVVTIQVTHTPTTRTVKLYYNDEFANHIVLEQPFAPINHGGEIQVAIDFDHYDDEGKLLQDPKNYNYSGVWEVKLWNSIQLPFPFSEVAPTPTQEPIAYWPLIHQVLQDVTGNNPDARPFPPATGSPQTFKWGNIICIDEVHYDPYAPEQISLADEKIECIKRFNEIGRRDAQIILDRKRNELRAELTAQYNQDCLDTEETFTYSYQTAEHHYTLYYYDQAGNLVQTVSPEGVKTDGLDNHNLKTRYKYNSLNAPIDQETPDAGKSEFFYDKVARIRLSQNAQQKADQNYSYTKYDAQGRITEVGQLEGKQDATPLDINVLELELDNIDFPSQTDYILTQITRTFYDDQATGTPTQITPKNLRGRIAAVKVFEDGQNLGAATFYDYDIHGNVEKLVQKLPDLDPKTVEYDYDLLSGNVHRVTYQKGRPDQFMHKYRYDADNRLEAVFTSSDGYIWDEDARYLYYAHGPMARVELGEYKVQGVDYYYTLQGWIKGVNLQGDHDADTTNNIQKYVSKDAFGYALHYYQNDYQSISGNFGWNATGGYSDLYNGNIAAMSTTLKTAGEQTMLYRYDQLNRIKTAVSDISSGNGYQSYYNYDANGNILALARKNATTLLIDDIRYTYNTTQNNRLQSVNDVSANNEGLESGNHSYTYDEIGNLTSDKDIESIQWTVYGKIAKVKKRDLTEIEYKYDGTGQRIYKKVATTTVTKETHYVRDGSGNVLAIYENKVIDELVIYGSSRLGSYNAKTDQGKRTLGNKKYELSNHLGNVLSVISDNKIGIGTNGVADYYEPLVISESDYYPFGMAMKERSFSNEEYRFGFNTQEKSTEIGEDTYTAEFWQYDSKIARRWNVDPVVKHNESSYAAFAGNPIWFVDINGADTLVVNTQMLENTGKTVIFKVTLSLIKNGVETAIEYDIPEGGDGFYFMLPREYWVSGNVWYQEGQEDMFSVRFEPYKKKINSIRVKYTRGENNGNRALAHFGEYNTNSKGCPIPTCKINKAQDEYDIEGNLLYKSTKIESFKSQEVLNTIRSLYDEYIPSSQKTDKFGRLVSVPDEGYDFMFRTNYVAKTQLSTVLKDLPKPEIKLFENVEPTNSINFFQPKGN